MDQIADLYAAQPFWAWAGLAAVLLAIEVLSGSGWLLWASASAALTGAVAALAGTGVPVTIVVFAALTMVSTLAARRYLPRSVPAHGGDINDNIARLVGHRGVTVGAFTGGAGRVSIDGKEWAARLDEGAELAVGANVEVTGVEGAHLRVRSA